MNAGSVRFWILWSLVVFASGSLISLAKPNWKGQIDARIRIFQPPCGARV